MLPLHYLVHHSADVRVFGEETRGGWGTVREENKSRAKNCRVETGIYKRETKKNKLIRKNGKRNFLIPQEIFFLVI